MATKSWYDPLLASLAKIHAQHQYNRFMVAARRAARTQQQRLFDNLARNSGSDYGQAHGFSTTGTYEEFARRVPIQTYEDLQPYVKRVMAGDMQALFGTSERVLMFAMTSGSTDSPKFVPVTGTFVNEYRRGWNVFGLKALLDHGGAFLRPIVQVVSPMDEERAACGLPCGSISGLLAATQKKLVRKYFVTPKETGHISDPVARYYTIMRFAVPGDVGWMVTASPATQLKLARSAEDHAERLIRDIHDGTLNPPGAHHMSPEAVETLRVRLEPDQAAAQRLERLLEVHGELLPRHYWNLAFLANWTGGSMALHLRDFPHYFGDTPVRDIGLLATEGRASLCLEDGTPVGVLDVMGSFFEFVEVGGNGDPLPASVCRCHEVVPGREYRLIMTTSAGFYRYDIGDHVRVHGFLGEAPLIEFLHRGEHTSSITGEKLTEWQVTTAFERARRHLGFGGDAFVLAPQWGDPPRYVLHVERDVQRIERLARAMDEELAKINPEYASKRGSRRLGLIVAEQLPDGALAAWNAARARRRGPVNEQFKPRYLLNDPEEEKKLAAFAVPPDQTESDSRADAEVSLGSTEHRTSSG